MIYGVIRFNSEDPPNDGLRQAVKRFQFNKMVNPYSLGVFLYDRNVKSEEASFLTFIQRSVGTAPRGSSPSVTSVDLLITGTQYSGPGYRYRRRIADRSTGVRGGCEVAHEMRNDEIFHINPIFTVSPVNSGFEALRAGAERSSSKSKSQSP